MWLIKTDRVDGLVGSSPTGVGRSASITSTDETNSEYDRFRPHRISIRADAIIRFSSWSFAFAWLALAYAPSLLPRSWVLQGVVAGLAFALGAIVGSAWDGLRRAVRRKRSSSNSRTRRFRGGIRRGIALTVASLLAIMLVRHYHWRVDVQQLMSVEGSAIAYLVSSLALALVVGRTLVYLGHLTARGVLWYARSLAKVLPAFVTSIVVAVTVVGVVVSITDGLILDRGFTAFEESFQSSDLRFDREVVAPTSPTRSGSPDSLIGWDKLGRQGRNFVSGGPQLDAIAAFAGESVLDPVRVYVGIQTPGSIDQRAQLAIDELERSGAFERRVLVAVLPTGTGWIDPWAIDALEYMYAGDTAAVGLQYSYFPSWMVLLRNQDEAIDAARALVRAIEGRLSIIPESTRPTFLIYGQSLGSFGLEAVFEDIDDLRSRVDGALLVGPPAENRLWQRLISGRDDGTPVWEAVYRGGAEVRFGGDGPTLAAASRPWLAPRIAYLQHPSDPITWHSFDMMFHEPAWMTEERGPDVSQEMDFIPVVTFCQVVVDLLVATGAPIGHGHKFGVEQAEAWALVAPPPNWSASDSDRLIAAMLAEQP